MTHGEKVKAAILAEGLAIWRAAGQGAVSARRIGKALAMTHGAVLYHYNAANLHEAIARHAVAEGDTVVIPQLIASRHAAVSNMSDADRSRYLAGC